MSTFLENNIGPNKGWLYYKKYYDSTVTTKLDIKKINDLICDAQLRSIKPVYSDLKILHFTTSYPGLVLGTGYTHEQKKSISKEMSEEAFKIGFYFDNTSGIPVIPGSSVKGLLRSAFPQRVVTPQKVTVNQIEKENWIKEILTNICGITEEVNIDELEREIFDGARKEADAKNPGLIVFNYVPIYERDIFFDAVPIEITENNIGGSKKQLLGSDYITPHKLKDRNHPELDPFSDPNPIKFLKIMPKVKFEFRFKLEQSKVLPALDAENKRKLFQEIIKTFGAGAKTNVGYGQFEEAFQIYEPTAEHSNRTGEPKNFTGKIKKDAQLEALVIDQENKKVKVMINGTASIYKLTKYCPENDSLVIVKIDGVNKKNEILSVGFIKQVRH